MYEVQHYDYDEHKDEFVPSGLKVPFLTLNQAKESVIAAHNETEDYYLITKTGNDHYKLWHDEI